MLRLRNLLAIAIVTGAAGIASAQDSAARSEGNVTRLSDPYMPSYSSRHMYRSRTAPQQPAYDPDSDYGFRNPGGVGRSREFYPPGNVFERGTDRVKVATFDNGHDATSRDMQLRSQMVGNARMQTINQHIDAYGRPFGLGYGFGFGGFGGFPY